MTLRQTLLKLHLFVGCIAAPFLFVAGLSGALLVFEGPYTETVANGHLTHVEPGSALLPLDALRDSVRVRYPGSDIADVEFPPEGTNTYAIGVTIPGSKGGKTLFVDPWRGAIVGDGASARAPLRWAHDLHTRLKFGQPGRLVVTWVAVALVFLSLTGLWLWWPGKILRVQTGASTRRQNFELHNMLGGLSWVFMLIFGLSGIVVHWEDGAGTLLYAVTGASRPAMPPKPAPTCAGQPMASLDIINASIAAAMPGANATMIRFGDKATDVVQARLRFPEDKTPAGRSVVIAERCTGKVIYTLSTRAAPFAWRYPRMWNRSIHTGDVWGWPTRILAVILALVLPLMTLTGPIIWFQRRTKKHGASST